MNNTILQKILINPVLSIRPPTDQECKRIRSAGYTVSARCWRLMPGLSPWQAELGKMYQGEAISTGIIVTI